MKYCRRCILPDSRPSITIDAEGVCSGCRGYDDKATKIDWAGRQRVFADIIAEAKSRSSGYDCVVPVSGGKDSWYQVIRCLEFKLKPLCITWRTPARTAIGQRNVDMMISKLGVDHIDYTINPDVERRFMMEAFEKVGDPGLPMHMALFNIPARLAQQMRIPLIVWGENPQLEFGGDGKERLATDLDDEWRQKHGCMMGTTPDSWIGERLSADDLRAYQLSSDTDFIPKSIFLGAFFEWNSFENAKIAAQHGFAYERDNARVGTWDFADIDCDFISLHHYPKWHKFAMTRAWDNLSQQIRYGMSTRDEAIAELKRIGLQTPVKDIQRFCEFAGKPESWFYQTCEKFRNLSLWRNEGGVWKVPGFLIPDWRW